MSTMQIISLPYYYLIKLYNELKSKEKTVYYLWITKWSHNIPPLPPFTDSAVQCARCEVDGAGAGCMEPGCPAVISVSDSGWWCIAPERPGWDTEPCYRLHTGAAKHGFSIPPRSRTHACPPGLAFILTIAWRLNGINLQHVQKTFSKIIFFLWSKNVFAIILIFSATILPLHNNKERFPFHQAGRKRRDICPNL